MTTPELTPRAAINHQAYLRRHAVLRRWRAGESQIAIGLDLGITQPSIARMIRQARSEPPPEEEQNTP